MKFETNCSVKKLESYLIVKINSCKRFFFYMTFLNAFLAVFRKKEQRRRKNKEIKTLNTLLSQEARRGPVKEGQPWKRFVLFYMYIFLNLGSWNQFNWRCKYENPSHTISRKNLPLYSVIIRCFFSISFVVFFTDQAFTWGKTIKNISTVHGMS